MKIDKNNYEIYFLDYMEGRLPAEETAELLIFAEENPDLKELIEGEELMSLVPDQTINFYPKSVLKRNSVSGEESGQGDDTLLNTNSVASELEINERNCEEVMIRFYENDLNDTERIALIHFLKDNPIFFRAFEIFGNTLLKPDTGIIYPHKARLKRNIIQLPGFKKVIAIISVAASVLLFSTLFLKYIDQPNPRNIDKQIARSTIRTIEPVKLAKSTINATEFKPAEINRLNNAAQPTPTDIREIYTAERTSFKAPSTMIIRQATLLTTTRISFPQTIERRTDFDGITSIAYYDPDPDALPLNTEGKTIGGRLGYTLAQGITQTAGTIAREPEIGRLLHGKISLSDIAGLGLAGFNFITDRKLSISRDYDSDGHLSGYSLNDGVKRLTRLP